MSHHISRRSDIAIANLVINLLLLLLIFCPVASRSGTLHPDSVSAIHLTVKMNKAVETGIFRPGTDLLSIDFGDTLPALLLVRNAGNLYTGSVTDGLDSGRTYHFRARINDTLYEDVSRSFTAAGISDSVEFWWNNDPPAIITFRIDMQYMTSAGVFNPLTDSVELIGNVNNYQGSGAMQKEDTTLVYWVQYAPDPGETCIFYFRIFGDTVIAESSNRFLLVPDTNRSITCYFNNIHPGFIPMEFNCAMQYQILAGHFTRGTDYLEVIGNFNQWSGGDILAEEENDSIYSATLLIDTLLARYAPLEFRFRMSGDPQRTELQGLLARGYNLPDTGGIYSAWFNNHNPAIPTPPWVYNVGIQGLFVNKQIITGHYSYENCNFIPEGTSLYQWYRSNDSLMVDMTPIDTATRITYTIDTLDVGRWLVFEVTPVAASGDSATGKPSRVITGCRIGAVGMAENQAVIAKIYPNPCTGYLVVESRFHLAEISMISTTGQVMGSFYPAGDKRFTISNLTIPPGMYLIRATTTGGHTGFSRFIRQ